MENPKKTFSLVKILLFLNPHVGLWWNIKAFHPWNHFSPPIIADLDLSNFSVEWRSVTRANIFITKITHLLHLWRHLVDEFHRIKWRVKQMLHFIQYFFKTKPMEMTTFYSPSKLWVILTIVKIRTLFRQLLPIPQYESEMKADLCLFGHSNGN